jgi:hypothetical protein
VTKEARSETQKNDAKSQIEQNHIGHAMTSQKNLSADTDRARSFNQNCKMEWQKNNKKERKVLDKIANKKEIDQQAEY